MDGDSKSARMSVWLLTEKTGKLLIQQVEKLKTKVLDVLANRAANNGEGQKLTSYRRITCESGLAARRKREVAPFL